MKLKKLRPVGPTFVIRVLPEDASKEQSQIEDPRCVKIASDAISTRGVVVDVSPYAWTEWFDGKPWAKLGDIVRVWSYSGNNDTIDGVMYRVCQDKDIWCVEEYITEDKSEVTNV